MTDLLAVTLGNTSVAAATAGAGGALRDVCREPLERLEAMLGPRLEAAEGPVCVCSVNPPALGRLRRTAEAAGRDPPKVAGLDFPVPIRTDVAEPARVGTDRLLAALAAHRRTQGACIVVDVGTAVTVDAVDEAGTFLGGAIFPGPRLMARSLADGTAQLPPVEISSVGAGNQVIGKNTEAAIRIGVTRALSGALGYILTAMLLELGVQGPVFVTGGDAPATENEADVKDTRYVVAPDLVLEGLVLAWGEPREP